MKTPEHWVNLIQGSLRGHGDLNEEHEDLIDIVQQIQADACDKGQSDNDLLLEYHSQQKEWWRTNTNDPHNIGTALYAMHCDMVNIYNAIVSGDARRNYEANAKIVP